VFDPTQDCKSATQRPTAVPVIYGTQRTRAQNRRIRMTDSQNYYVQLQPSIDTIQMKLVDEGNVCKLQGIRKERKNSTERLKKREIFNNIL